MTRLAIVALLSLPLGGCLDIPGASHPVVQGALSGAVSGALKAYTQTGVIGQALSDQCAKRAALDLDQRAAVDAFRPQLAAVCDRI